MSKTTYRFRLTAGTYSEGDKFYSAVGLNRKAGDEVPIVESERELDKVFKNKFERILSDEQTSAKPVKPPQVDDDDDDNDNNDDDDPKVTLKAVKRKRGMWDVVMVVDGKETDDCVNNDFLSKADALARVKEGYTEGDED